MFPFTYLSRHASMRRVTLPETPNVALDMTDFYRRIREIWLPKKRPVAENPQACRVCIILGNEAFIWRHFDGRIRQDPCRLPQETYQIMIRMEISFVHGVSHPRL